MEENTDVIALFTQISIGPSSSSTCWAAASICAASATSTLSASALPPAASTSRRAPSRPSLPRAIRPTHAPCFANSLTVARPTPADAPVITTTSLLPTSLLRSSSTRFGCRGPPCVFSLYRSAILFGGRLYPIAECLPLFQLIERAQNCAKDRMRDHDREGRLHSIVQRQKARRLQHVLRLGSMLFTGHARMNTGQQAHPDHQNKRGVHQSDHCSAPPPRFAQGLEEQNVEQGEGPAQGHVHAKTVEFGLVAIGSEDGAQHVRQVHPREPHALRGGAHGCQHDRRGKAPDEPAMPVHTFASLDGVFTSAPVWPAG